MTIENARALQEQLANEAIAQMQKTEARSLPTTAPEASPSLAKRGAFRPTKRHAGSPAQQAQTQHVGDAGPRENTEDSGTRHPAPDEVVKVMQLVWDMFETALDLGDDAERYRLFDTANALAAVYLPPGTPPEWLGAKPIVS